MGQQANGVDASPPSTGGTALASHTEPWAASQASSQGLSLTTCKTKRTEPEDP